MDHEDSLLMRYQMLAPELTERTLRLFAAAEAKAWGRGGISGVARVLELSRDRISRGLRDLEKEERLGSDRIRRKGGGRKKQVLCDPELKEDLERLQALGYIDTTNEAFRKRTSTAESPEKESLP